MADDYIENIRASIALRAQMNSGIPTDDEMAIIQQRLDAVEQAILAAGEMDDTAIVEAVRWLLVHLSNRIAGADEDTPQETVMQAHLLTCIARMLKFQNGMIQLYRQVLVKPLVAAE